MGELDVAANGSHLLGLFEKLTYAGPHFCEQSRHGFLNVERLLAERVHQILVAVAVHGQEREVFGDQAYWKEADRQAYEARGVRYQINRRPNSRALLSDCWKKINCARSRTRARGEHPFRVVKHLWGFVKVRYRGLVKNLARAHAMFALANLYQVRHQLSPSAASCAL
jgi:IS5 family transposase